MNLQSNGIKAGGCIVGLLMVMASFVALSLSARQMGELLAVKQTQAHLKSVNGALRRYLGEHNNRFPAMRDASVLQNALYPAYLGDQSLFKVAHETARVLPNPNLEGKSVGDIQNFAATITLYAEPSTKNTPGVVVFIGGETQTVKNSQWIDYKSAANLP